MKLAECSRKPMTWIASRAEALMDALLRSGRRFNRNCATSATSTALATAAVTDEIEMATGVAIGTTAMTVTIATTIGGDEFQSLGINPHLIIRLLSAGLPFQKAPVQTPGPLSFL